MPLLFYSFIGFSSFTFVVSLLRNFRFLKEKLCRFGFMKKKMMFDGVWTMVPERNCPPIGVRVWVRVSVGGQFSSEAIVLKRCLTMYFPPVSLICNIKPLWKLTKMAIRKYTSLQNQPKNHYRKLDYVKIYLFKVYSSMENLLF